MKGPSLQKTAALSSALHVTVFLISVLLLKQTSHIVLPSPYTVNLVGHDIVPRESEKRREPSDQDSAAPVEKSIPKNEKISKNDEKRVDEMIDAIKAKKKIEIIGKLRKEISVGRSERPGRKPVKQGKGVNSSVSAGIPGGVAGYEDRIGDEIHKYWTLSGAYTKQKFETVVSVKIFKDGTISVKGIETSSGDRGFDKQVLKTIAMASPVSPPPYDIDVLLRFNNENAR